jgi:hypothetical protein
MHLFRALALALAAVGRAASLSHDIDAAAARAALATPRPPSAAAVALQSAINHAITTSSPTVVAESGAVFDFGSTNLEVVDAIGLSLLGSDSHLVFFPGYGVLLSNVTNSTLSGFTHSYSPPCFTQGIIVAVSASDGDEEDDDASSSSPPTVDVRLDDGYVDPSAAFFDSAEVKLQWYSGNDTARQRDPTQPAFQPALSFAEVSAGVWRFGTSAWRTGAAPQVGQLMSISPRLNTSGAGTFAIPDYYSGSALSILGSSSVWVSDYSLWGSGNFGVSECGGGGGHTYTRLTIEREPNSTHLMSTNCDGFHSFSTGTGGQFVDSVVSFTGDDLVNFHNRANYVLRNSSATTSTHHHTGSNSDSSSNNSNVVLVVDVGDIPSPWGGPTAPLRSFSDVQAGDTLRVFGPGEFGAPVANVTVASCALSTDAAALAEARALVHSLLQGRVNPAAVAVWEVSVASWSSPSSASSSSSSSSSPSTSSGPFPALSASDVVQFDRRASKGGTLLRVQAADIYDSCGRLQSSGVALLNTTCARARSGLTVVFDEAFAEGTRAIDGVQLVGNAFVSIGSPPFAATMAQVRIAIRIPHIHARLRTFTHEYRLRSSSLSPARKHVLS